MTAILLGGPLKNLIEILHSVFTSFRMTERVRSERKKGLNQINSILDCGLNKENAKNHRSGINDKEFG